ncbi:NYN domain-containing protein [Actinokineospora sp. G85]|uniref:NYN domain-containing protein n=1 Tax=Actinokineospora sp. G85 TaxID=3406626 RepID=UPI003C7955E7
MPPSSEPVPPAEPGPSHADGPAFDDAQVRVWPEALPEPVRTRLAEVAAAAVGALPAVDVPQQLRPVARFAPAKRAKLGGPVLVTALREHTGFRTAVVEWCREHRPVCLDLDCGDPAGAAAAALLVGAESAADRVAEVARRADDSSLRAERDHALARLARAEAELARVRERVTAADEAADLARAEGEVELDRLRKRLREQGVRLREAKDDAAAARAEAAAASSGVSGQVAALTERLDRERERAEAALARAARAEADAALARQAAREARQADEVRLALLIDTVDNAVSGLRRELMIGDGSGPRPADLVAGARAARDQRRRVDDPVGLDRLLALPTAHLIVDGYNVTKTGYSDLSLADQRERLIRQLSALAARTSIEVTLVFDGAGVVVVPVAKPRGVRVIFSDPGVQADDVIRTLVADEPTGRPLVVATSDRAVAEAIRDRGAYSVPSAVLLARLGRV